MASHFAPPPRPAGPARVFEFGLTLAGLVAFAGRAEVRCPLTFDYGFFRRILTDIQVGSVGLVVERVRPEGTLEKFQWYCPNCNNLVHEVETLAPAR